MLGEENRNIARDSLFVMARLRFPDSDEDIRVRVRNLSSGGLMAEAALGVVPGEPLSVEIRNIGWIEAVVAWVQDIRFGVAFCTEIDPRLARARDTGTECVDALMRRPPTPRQRFALDPRHVRKV
jgi:hypothetical protein